MSEKKWYYSKSEKKYEGPVSKENLSSKIDDKIITEETLVWKEGYDDWKPILKIPEFASSFVKVNPPPLPNKEEGENKFDDQQSIDFHNKLHRDYKSREEINSINKPKKPEDLFADEDEHKTDRKDNQTHRWLKFYVNLRIPLGVFFILINVLSPPQYLSPADEDIFKFIGGAIILIYLILFWGLYKRKLWGWKFNWLFIFVEPIVGPLGTGTNSVLLFIYIAGGLILYSIPNYIYFKRRKHLFSKN